MRKLVFILTLFFVSLPFPAHTLADLPTQAPARVLVRDAAHIPVGSEENSIQLLDLNVELHGDGSATFTEHRQFTIEDGTEHYIPLTNLDGSELRDFRVSEGEKLLKYVGEWDVDWSLEEKAGKYGINETDEGLELCFGVGTLGSHGFTITYTLTDVVRELEDGNQVLYWSFYSEGSDPVDVARVSVTNDAGREFSAENTEIAGYGFEGQSGLTSDALTLTAENLTEDNRMVLLAIFDPGTFRPAVTMETDVAGIKELANDGATWDDVWTKGDTIAMSIIGGAATLAGIIGAFVFRSRLKDAEPQVIGFTASDEERYNREIPQERIEDVAVLLRGVSTDNWMSAYLLKWVTQGYLVPLGPDADAADYSFYLAPEVGEMVKPERNLWEDITKAAGKNGELHMSELEEFYEENHDRIVEWEEIVRDHSTAYLRDRGAIREVRKGKVFPRRVYELTPAGQELTDRLYAFKHYLEDYARMGERSARDIEYADELFVWAAFFGIAEDLIADIPIDDPVYRQQFVFTSAMIVSINNTTSSSFTAASISGGTTSLGGGVGSFGGGGGGSR